MKVLQISEELLDILKHSVGYPKLYRNFFCATLDSKDYYSCCNLCSIGLMYKGKQINEGEARSQYFYVSDEGKELLSNLDDGK